MRTLGIRVKENPFYVPYEDECWIILAQEIMNSYATKYAYQSPTTAFTQEEYDRLNTKTFAPIRMSILRRVKTGPLRNVVDMTAVYAAFEQRRREYLNSMGIFWRDTWDIDVTKL